MYYRIKSYTGDLYLSLNNNDTSSGLIVNSKQNDDSQLWQGIAIIATNGAFRGIALVNKKTPKAIHSPKNDGALTLIDVTPDMQRATWNVGGVAIQLRDNTDMNLNVAGNGPYQPGNPVLAYNWSEGKPNEKWTWVEA